MVQATGGFPTTMSAGPAPGVVGDFCDHNPRHSVDAGPGGLVAGPNGLTIGRFAWWSPRTLDGDGAPREANSYGSGPVTGFVHREQQGMLTAYLQEASMHIIAGKEVTLMSSGGYWVVNDGVAPAVIGQKAFANFADGSVSFAAAGAAAPITGGATASIAVQTATLTGSIAGNVLTVTAQSGDLLLPGAILTGTAGDGIVTGTKVVGQLSGTTGGVGTYALDYPNQTIPSGAISATYGLATVSAISAGNISVGDVLSGTGITVGTNVTALGTGIGQLGTYIVSPSQALSSTVLVVNGAIETKWTCMSPGAVGEIVKISSQPLG